MKKFFTIFFLFIAALTFSNAQSCPSSTGTGGNSAVRWLNSGLFVINDASDASTLYNALATTGTAISVTGTVVGGTNDGNAFNLSGPLTDWTNPSATRIRPASSGSGNNGESATFSGTITFTLANGSTLSCVYVAGVYQGALPVELVSFNAKLKDDQVVLDWITASELDNNYFSIEHSNDGRIFKELDQVKGAGTTNVSQTYQFIDQDLGEGVNYYRLRQVDFNGDESFSSIVQVNKRRDTKVGDLSIFPTIVQNDALLTIDFSGMNESVSTIEIVNISGRVVATYPVNLANGREEISVDGLTNGMYLIRTTISDRLMTGRFLKLR